MKVVNKANIKMQPTKYLLSYTTGAALIVQTKAVVALYIQYEDWTVVRSHVLEENTFQVRTMSTLKKLYGEIARRLNALSNEELQYLVNGSDQESRALIWLAICRRYRFIRDYTIEVIGTQYAASRFLLTKEDYDAFFNGKAAWHQNLDNASTKTKHKAKQVLFKMLRECALINEQNEILKQNLSQQLVKMIEHTDHSDLLVFPGLDVC